MKRILSTLIFILLAFTGYANGVNDIAKEDTNEVKALNHQAFENRLTDPAQTIYISNKALVMAQKLNYNAGIAEAYRVIGLGQSYANMLMESISSYINALTYYQKDKDLRGVASVYNNIGNLYRDNDYDRSLDFFNKALAIAIPLKDQSLIARINLSLGNFYYRKNSFTKALSFYNKSEKIFEVLKDSVNIIQCLQNRGVAYFRLNQLDTAENLLVSANRKAKERDLNESVASIDLTLALLYVTNNKFAEAEKILSEGLVYSQILKDDKLEHDFKYTNFQLEFKRKNFEGALRYLTEVYKQDSVDKKGQLTSQIMLFEERKSARTSKKKLNLPKNKTSMNVYDFGV